MPWIETMMNSFHVYFLRLIQLSTLPVVGSMESNSTWFLVLCSLYLGNFNRSRWAVNVLVYHELAWGLFTVLCFSFRKWYSLAQVMPWVRCVLSFFYAILYMNHFDWKNYLDCSYSFYFIPTNYKQKYNIIKSYH